MATRPEAIPPKAGACVSFGWEFGERYSVHRCLAYTGFMSGLTLGLALSHIDPEWAKQAYAELIEHEASAWGQAGMPAEQKRLATWKQAQDLIRASARRENSPRD